MLVRRPLSPLSPTLPARHKRRAAAVVEFAVIAPLLFLVVLGIIEFGRAMMVGELVTNAARHGCRRGVLVGKTTADVQTAVTESLSHAGVHGETVTVLVNGTAADAGTAVAGDRVEVRVAVPAAQNAWVPTLSFLGHSQLVGTAVMRRE